MNGFCVWSFMLGVITTGCVNNFCITCADQKSNRPLYSLCIAEFHLYNTMPVSDPLLKSLKYLIEEFYSIDEVVTDGSPYLASFCQTVEHAITKGIKLGSWDHFKSDGQSIRRKQFWTILEYFHASQTLPLAISTAVRAAQNNKSLKHNDGRLRYFIRQCLIRRMLHVVVEFLRTRKEELESSWYDSNEGNQEQHNAATIITHEVLAEQLRSLLLTVSTSITFEINLENFYFLDHTWNIPDMRTVEFVPTQYLGIGMLYIDGYGIITKLRAGSVAADQKDLGIGDLLVTMNEYMLFPAKKSGDNEIVSIWKKCRKKDKPCRLTVIKPRCPATRGIFPPLRRVLSEYQDVMDEYYNTQKEKIEEKLREAEERKASSLAPEANKAGTMSVAESNSGCGRHSVTYVGKVFVGEQGGMGEIEHVIKSALVEHSAKAPVEVILEITEIGVLVKTKEPTESKPLRAEKKDNVQSLLGASFDLLADDDIDKVTLPVYSEEDASNIVFNHKFADISSCGKIVRDEKHFCYIAGDTFCTISKQFHGYVFTARSLGQAKLILNSIYQGFKRTTFFM